LDVVSPEPGYTIFNFNSLAFLPAITPSLVRDGGVFSWNAAPFDVETVDVVARTPALTWHASLPADVTSASLPASVSLDATDDVELTFSTGDSLTGIAATHAYGFR
jgi:hypothetical protein